MAAAVEATIRDVNPALRIPIGQAAARILAARMAAPKDQVFLAAPLIW